MSMIVTGLVLVLVYIAVHAALCVGPFTQRYNPLIAWFLQRQGMAAITIGAHCFLADRNRPLTPQGEVHERWHFHQWRVRPFMAPVYLFWLLVVGYDHHPLENEARRAADQPER